MNSSFFFVCVHGFYTCVRYLYLVLHIRVIICIYLVSSNICVYIYRYYIHEFRSKHLKHTAALIIICI